MTDGPVLGKYMIRRAIAGFDTPAERRLVRVDSLTGDPEAPYWATHVATLRHIIINDDFEREATQEEADAARKRIEDSLARIDRLIENIRRKEERKASEQKETGRSEPERTDGPS